MVIDKRNREITGKLDNSTLFFVLEYLTSTLIFYLFYLALPQYKLIWGLIFIAVVLSPRSADSPGLVYDRIIANFIGATIGFIILALFDSGILSVCLGSVLIIFLCHVMNKIDTARCALLTLMAVVIPSYHEPGYAIAVERIICVTAGLITALIVNIIYSYIFSMIAEKAPGTGQNRDKN
jgi:uncharacterized membrane protein YgaE (UPF0421/DUF939 family)